MRQWSKHSSNSCWSKLVGGHDTFAIDGDIAKKRWDHCTEMRPEVLSCWSQFFQSWRKKTQNATEKCTMKLLCLGGGIVVPVFGELDLCILGLLLHWHTGDGLALVHWTSHLLRCHLTPESGNRTRTSMSSERCFQKGTLIIYKKNYKYTLHAYNHIYTHITILQNINKHMLYIHVYVNITTWLFFHRSKFPPMPALPVTWAW